MKYGFTVPRRGPLATPDSLAAIARRGEELGYHLEAIRKPCSKVVPLSSSLLAVMKCRTTAW